MVYRRYRTYKRYPNRKAGKKRYYRRRQYSRRRIVPKRPVLGNGFAQQQVCKLRYVDTKTFTYNADGSLALHNFSCNSIFDPDFTGVGHQPLGHDQWQLIYKRYLVLGSKIMIRVLASSDDNLVYPVTVGVQLTNDGTVSSNLNTLLENKQCSFVNINQQPGLAPPRLVTRKYSPKKHFGFKDVRDNSDEIGADFGASPAEPAYFTMFYGSASGAALPEAKTVVCQITIDYICLFSDPIKLATS